MFYFNSGTMKTELTYNDIKANHSCLKSSDLYIVPILEEKKLNKKAILEVGNLCQKKEVVGNQYYRKKVANQAGWKFNDD